MKKFIAITISLCLIFCSIVPVFAADHVILDSFNANGTYYSAGQVMQSILSYLAGFDVYLNTFFNTRNIAGGNVIATFQDLYALVDSITTWLIPSTNTSSTLSIWDFLLLIATRVDDYMYSIDNNTADAISYLSGILTSTNNVNSNIIKSLTNYRPGDAWTDVTNSSVREFAHRQLITNNSTGEYAWKNILVSGNTNDATRKWGLGTPLGNIALILSGINTNFVNQHSYLKTHLWEVSSSNDWLYHAKDQLSVWDSQGDTLTQDNFTPESLAQGLYKYLAYTQRDVARLTYVLANDAELEAREKSEDAQEAIVDNFIDNNGNGSVSPAQLGSVADYSSGFTSNFNTGVSGSNIWGAFDNNHYSWFSQATKNSLDTTQQTRGGEDYPTPLLDAYYDEIMTLFGGDDKR